MFFGFANEPATFQSYINKYLAEKQDIFVIVYLDDIFMHINEKSAKYEEAVRWVLEQLQKYELYINFKKYRFSTNKVYFFGYIVLSLGIYMESEHVNSIKN